MSGANSREMEKENKAESLGGKSVLKHFRYLQGFPLLLF